MQKAGPSTRVTVPLAPRDGPADDVQGLATEGETSLTNFHYRRSGITIAGMSEGMSTEPVLVIDDLHAGTTEGGEILRGVSISVAPGELHVVMGPNGSGKSTLAKTLLANPTYEVTAGRVLLKGEDISELSTEERAQRGLFLGFQHPEEFAGVTVLNFLRQAMSARKGFDMSVLEVRLALMDWMNRLSVDQKFMDRYLNDGFSGGEKKRSEVLQMALLEPDMAILDETDSGLDIDALKIVAEGINEVRKERPEMGVLLITHYQRILRYLTPDVVHIFVGGQVVESGGLEIAERLEIEGYEAFRGAEVTQ
jgi:Fe-S cluster assembly ATP-binding protein